MLDLRIDEHFVIRIFNYRATSSKPRSRKVIGGAGCAVNSDVIVCKKAQRVWQRLVGQVIDSPTPPIIIM